MINLSANSVRVYLFEISAGNCLTNVSKRNTGRKRATDRGYGKAIIQKGQELVHNIAYSAIPNHRNMPGSRSSQRAIVDALEV